MNQKPFTLAINTANSETSIALFDGGIGVGERIGSEGILGEGDGNLGGSKSFGGGEILGGGESSTLVAEKSWKSANDEAEKIMPEIAELLAIAGTGGSHKHASKDGSHKHAGTDGSHKHASTGDSHKHASHSDFSKIGRVLVVLGPGSFTGLRIGITVANTIAYLNKCDVFALDTFEYLHRRVEGTPVLLFAGKGGVYLSEKSGAEPKLINLPDLPDAVKHFENLSGDIGDDQREVIKSIDPAPTFLEPKKTFGEVMREFLSSISPSEETDFHTLKLVKPLYIKKPAITESKKKMSFA